MSAFLRFLPILNFSHTILSRKLEVYNVIMCIVYGIVCTILFVPFAIGLQALAILEDFIWPSNMKSFYDLC